MQFLRKKLDQVAPQFEKGGKFEKFHAFYEAPDTFLYTPGQVSKAGAHVRDAIDLKRMMVTVVVAMLPAVFFAMWNTGYQALTAVGDGAWWRDDFNTQIFQWVILTLDGTADLSAVDAGGLAQSWSWCFIYGALYFLPVWIVTFAVGGHIEMATAVIRKHEVNEGFLVTGFLFPMILPPTIPLWQVAIGIAFGVVVGKELFGGTGMNILNPALTGRAFLFFAYPAQISGDKVWTSVNEQVDTWSGATWLAKSANPALVTHTDGNGAEHVGNQVAYTSETLSVQQVGVDGKLVNSFEGVSLEWMDAFVGFMPGSMGETSALCCLIGAAILIITRVGSWHTMAGVVGGTIAMSFVLNWVGSDTNPLFDMPFYWHMVLGGWAFGAVFMATDPVSSAFTERGKLYYGLGIGIMVVLVRVVNPAYPEGMMLAILFMNLFAPLFDYFAIQGNIKRRAARYAA